MSGHEIIGHQMIGDQAIAQLTNHLWQSTVFAVAATLLTLAFRKNRAHVRYWVWLSASVKFLVPFALLMNLGNSLWTAFAAKKIGAELASPAVSLTAQQIAQPFTGGLSFVPSAPLTHTADWIFIALVGVWLCGFFSVVLGRLRGWMRVRAAVRASAPIDIHAGAAVRASSGLLEPGVVGVLRPVLLLPEDISKRLSPSQLEAVLAHELSHIRRRDNLTAAIHMIVEAVFWFHPFVWWIGARLVEERERACDEAVLSLGGEPRDYADAIVSVCKLYVESPLACVSGISGADLKKRIVRIMSCHMGLNMSRGRKVLLGAAALIALLTPFLAGIVNAQLAKSFEVISIHPLPPNTLMPITSDGGGMSSLTDSRLGYRGTVYGMILRAYSLRTCRSANCNFLVGGPSWIRSDKYQIDAKLPEGSPRYSETQYEQGEAEDLYQMLQTLLAERFSLKAHHESKEMPVYALTLGPGGHKLTPTAGATMQGSDGITRVDRRMGILPLPDIEGVRRFRMTVTNFTLQELADALSDHFDRPVLDRTGVSGRFDFTIEYEGDPETRDVFASAGGSGLITAFREQLGLRLQPAKGQVETLVIDHIERPSPN